MRTILRALLDTLLREAKHLPLQSLAILLTVVLAALGTAVLVLLCHLGAPLWLILPPVLIAPKLRLPVQDLIYRRLAADAGLLPEARQFRATRHLPVLCATFGFTSVVLFAVDVPPTITFVTASIAILCGLAGLAPTIQAAWSRVPLPPPDKPPVFESSIEPRGGSTDHRRTP